MPNGADPTCEYNFYTDINVSSDMRNSMRSLSCIVRVLADNPPNVTLISPANN